MSEFLKRPSVAELDVLLGSEIPCLDHGFVRVIDYMGDDSAIVQAARVSYGTGTKTMREDRGLIRYLMKHKHTTPFEMCEIKFHLKMPIFVARQWIRHRTANVNEYSARYSILDKEFYIPEHNQIMAQSDDNKQGRGADLPDEMKSAFRQMMLRDAENAYSSYETFMNIDTDGEPIVPAQAGMARELARIGLGLNYYTQMYWKIDLHNLLHFLKLRLDPHAQYEIRVYAQRLYDIVRAWVPMASEAFSDYSRHSVTLSKQQLTMLQACPTKKALEKAKAEEYGLSEREKKELLSTVHPD